jgi:hypothetical protein
MVENVIYSHNHTKQAINRLQTRGTSVSRSSTFHCWSSICQGQQFSSKDLPKMGRNSYGNTAPYSASYKSSSKTSRVKKYRAKFKVGQLLAWKFLFNSMPSEFFCVKNNSSEYELKGPLHRRVCETSDDEGMFKNLAWVIRRMALKC